MKKVYWYIAALILALIIVDRLTLPKGVSYALGAALGYMIGAIVWNAIKNRKKK
ncbi:MAG: hypothetical protein IKX24_11875 [Prevotella sp.]|nr:hypothetical protein [Prevotella sp.]